MTHERLFNLIFTGVAIAALGTAGYALYLGQQPLSVPPPVLSNQQPPALSPGTDRTADWKTYRNEEYGFEVKYPKQSTLRVESDERGLFALRMGKVQLYILERIHPRLSHFLTNPECYGNTTVKIYNSIYWTISRWQCGIGSEQNPIASSAIDEQKNLVYEIRLDDAESEEVARETMNQILATFKFIEPSATLDTSTWKTYRNEEYGFEVKYPAEARIFGDFNKDKQFSIFPYEVTEGASIQVALREQSVAAIRAEIIADYPNRIDLDRGTLFNGYNAREIVYRSEVGGPYKVVLIPNATNKTFVLRQPTDLHLGDAILSTFRFTE